MNPVAAVRRCPELAAVLAAQAALVAVVSRHATVSWQVSDAQTYFSQAVMLWQGLFPPNPVRPLFYPFYLSLGLKLFGLSGPGPALWQALPYLATTPLVWRAAKLAGGRATAGLAAGLYAFLPSALFYGSIFLLREPLTGFLLLLTINLTQLMLDQPDGRPDWRPAIRCGLAAGLLVLVKPEFGSLLALLAVIYSIAGARRRDLKPAASWIVCGLTALALTAPVVLLDRAVYHDWFFVNTYKGYNLYLSYCGRSDEPGGRSFSELEDDRFQRAHDAGVKIIYLSPDAVPYSERDNRLAKLAFGCIAADPGWAAAAYPRRLLSILFIPNHDALDIMQAGNFGPFSPAAVQFARFFSLLFNALTIFLLLPAAGLLIRTRIGRLVLIGIGWYVILMAAVYFVPRYRMAVWPLWAVAGGAGAAGLREWWRRGSRVRLLLIGWLLLAAAVSGPVILAEAARLLTPAEWVRPPEGQGISSRDQRDNLVDLAGSFIEAENLAGLDRELGGYIRDRHASLNRATLTDAGDYFARLGRPEGAAFFERMAVELYGPAAPVSP